MKKHVMDMHGRSFNAETRTPKPPVKYFKFFLKSGDHGENENLLNNQKSATFGEAFLVIRRCLKADLSGQTPLFIACDLGFLEIVQCLLESKADTLLH